MRTGNKKEEIIKRASLLFNQYGYKAVGIDRIIAESKIAKMTMYHHFKSKDDVILAVLTSFNHCLINQVLGPLEQKPWSDQRKIKHLIKVYHSWFLSDDFFGCPFHKAAAEFPDKDHPVHLKIKEHRDILLDFIAKNVRSKALALQILLVLEGSIIVAKTSGAKSATNSSLKVISLLLKF